MPSGAAAGECDSDHITKSYTIPAFFATTRELGIMPVCQAASSTGNGYVRDGYRSNSADIFGS
jgi:hypothetical protein